jgi:hypothetical protein
MQLSPGEERVISANSSNLNKEDKAGTRRKAMGWLKKLGWVGFLFFLIKGLAWLAVFYGLGRYIGLGSGE